jgi:N-acetylmuramoyl-L-alanine amidase-like protein
VFEAKFFAAPPPPLRRWVVEGARTYTKGRIGCEALCDGGQNPKGVEPIQIPLSFCRTMRVWKITVPLALICSVALAFESRLPFTRIFKGEKRFNRLVSQARSENWKSLPIGERTAAVGQALTGTRYKHFTLEIDKRIESPSVNLEGMDCWTFFEISLAFARMLNEPESNWTPETLLRYIEIDRYRNGVCTGEYLSRLHYLEDWLADNDRRGLVEDLTPALGGRTVPHSAREMTLGWRHYRYLAANRSLLGPLGQMEARVSSRPLYEIPTSRVAGIESKLQSGDIIGIISKDPGGLHSTSHVGLALRTNDGVLHFMHASAPHNYGRVVVDSELSKYLYHYRTDSGILVARPLK